MNALSIHEKSPLITGRSANADLLRRLKLSDVHNPSDQQTIASAFADLLGSMPPALVLDEVTAQPKFIVNSKAEDAYKLAVNLLRLGKLNHAAALFAAIALAPTNESQFSAATQCIETLHKGGCLSDDEVADFAGQVWALASYCEPPAHHSRIWKKWLETDGRQVRQDVRMQAQYHGSLLATKEVATAAASYESLFGNKTAAANRLAQIVMKAAEMGDGGTVDYTVATMAALRARDSQGPILDDMTRCLFEAYLNGRADLVQLLRGQLGVERIDAFGPHGRTLLGEAALKGDLKMVESLIKAGARIDAATLGRTPLFFASFEGHEKVVDALIKAGADVNARDEFGSTPLTGAAQGHLTILQKLLEAGADVDAREKDGRTALHVAAENRNAQIVEELIKARADVNALEKGDCTLLQRAAACGSPGIVEKLIEARADVNARNQTGSTALAAAARRGSLEVGSLEVVEKLIEAGANINTPVTDGTTPLHIAATYGDLPKVQTLLRHRADPNAVAGDGETPLDKAVKRGHDQVVKALTEAGAYNESRASSK